MSEQRQIRCIMSQSTGRYHTELSTQAIVVSFIVSPSGLAGIDQLEGFNK